MMGTPEDTPSLFVRTALEMSVYASPDEPGLTHEEIFELGRRMGFANGEIGDALEMGAAPMYLGDKYLRPSDRWLPQEFPGESPNYRRAEAFDYVLDALTEVEKEHGRHDAKLDRLIVEQKGVAAGFTLGEMKIATSYLVLSGWLGLTKEGFLTRKSTYPSPMTQMRQPHKAHRRPDVPGRAKIYAHVHDVVSRRVDGRPVSSDPLLAFREALDKHEPTHLGLWWTQAVRELSLLDPQHTPVALAVTAGSLIEGALTFAAKFARANKLPVFTSSDYAGDPSKWRLSELIASAASGGTNAVLDLNTKVLAETANETRNRIHAGRVMGKYPTGAPDLRPEEATASRDSAKKVARAVLDWLARVQVPPTPPAGQS